MPKVLVVDDEPDQRFALRRIFERAPGTRWSRPRTVSWALHVVGRTRPGWIGAELIKRLHADAATVAVPIRCVSGHGYPAEGADAVLVRPYKLDELISVTQDLSREGSGGR